MALINVREVYPNVFLGLWQTTETVDGFSVHTVFSNLIVSM